ncbi:hypothetical protein [Penaeicola halotolerans]|uniref:hypothetical protein n=1 Tax=Penaeicola halotolerans TaxID=2793196 RepID=UPI001CF86F96|nr:hypothetical protein [Penaeicola halotolerans]
MQTNENIPVFTMPMRGILLLAGIYNLAWGLFIKFFPEAFFQWMMMAKVNTPKIIEWQGMGVIFFGILYVFSAFYPIRSYLVIGLGAASKVLGAAWFFFFVIDMELNKRLIFHLIANDLIWFIPLLVIFLRAKKVRNHLIETGQW